MRNASPCFFIIDTEKVEGSVNVLLTGLRLTCKLPQSLFIICIIYLFI